MNKDDIIKSEIIENARNLFQQYGLKKTTMDEIAESCGKAKSTLYHYFRNKDEVFNEVVGLEIKSIRKAVDNVVKTKNDLVSKMKAYFVTFHEEVNSRLNVYRILKQEIRDHMRKYEQFFRIIDYEKAYISRFIEEGIDKGEFTEFDKREVPWFSEMLILAFLGILEYKVKSDNIPDSSNIEKISDVIIPRVFV